MRSLRRTYSAVLVVAAMLAALGAPLAGAQPTGSVCAAQHHDCGKTVQLKPCCCGPQRDGSESGTIVPIARIAADQTPLSLAAVGPIVSDADARLAVVRIDRSPPRPPSTDLPTLFSTLLI